MVWVAFDRAIRMAEEFGSRGQSIDGANYASAFTRKFVTKASIKN